MYDIRTDVRWPVKKLEQEAWSHFMHAAVAHSPPRQKVASCALGEALPGESPEELDRMAEEDQRLKLLEVW